MVIRQFFGPMAKRIGQFLGIINPLRWLYRLFFALGNWRRGRFKKLDYILLTLSADLPALPEARGWLRRRVQGAPSLSLLELDRCFQQIGEDPRPKGIVLNLRGLQLSLADLQTLRNSILRLREHGKQVICYAQEYDNAAYYVASAADEIWLQPGGGLSTIGLSQRATFLKDALDKVGVNLDVVAISPYKSAFDQFAARDFSPESREQLEWLLDSRFEMLVNGIAEGRKLSPEAVRQMIDAAPYLDTEALEAGYVDAVIHEEQFAEHLKVEHLVLWDKALKVLRKSWHKPSRKYVALLPLGGLIISGESGKPPVKVPIPFLGDQRMGDLTVVRQVRNLMKDKNAAAVVVFVDSGGGSSVASEAMTSALMELAKDRPLVVYMNSVAASGGYYISTPARWIVAQPGTLTGSIGVIAAKAVTNKLWEHLHTHRVELSRGANATWQSDSAPFTDVQRERMHRHIVHIYDQFVGHVARSRSLSAEEVDALGGGRVWTGIQAQEKGLVDELGDLQAAFKKAREFADLPEDAPVILLTDKSKPLAPQLAEEANPAAALQYLQANQQAIFNGSMQMLMPFLIE